MFFPIAVLYKSSLNTTLTAPELMKKLNKLFFELIKKIFWDFIQDFWKYVKKDLEVFLEKLVLKITKNKLKKYKTIITSLINLLTKLLNFNIDNCDAIYNAIITTMNTALNAPIKLPTSNFLLVFSDQLPGYSNDRASINITERLENSGIPTGDLYGVENDLNTIIRCIIDGNSQERDENEYIKIALKPGIIPSGPGGAIISPLISGVGKAF
jgi:hypothetical protein